MTKENKNVRLGKREIFYSDSIHIQWLAGTS